MCLEGRPLLINFTQTQKLLEVAKFMNFSKFVQYTPLEITSYTIAHTEQLMKTAWLRTSGIGIYDLRGENLE